MRLTRGTAVFCIATGVSIIALWTMLFVTGQVADAANEPWSHAFHFVAEGLTAGLLVVSGVAILALKPHARRFFYFATGLLIVAAAGMLVVYVTEGSPPFIALGVLVVGMTLLFLWRSRLAAFDAVYVALGSVLYVELNVFGNLLQAGDGITAAYVGIAALVTFPVTVAALRRRL